MIRLMDQDQNVLGTLLYSKNIPRVDELLVQDGNYYRVFGVIYDDDEGDIIICVQFLGARTKDMTNILLMTESAGLSPKAVKDMALSVLSHTIRQKQQNLR